MKFKYLFFLIPLLFSSCIEIIDDLTLNADGSGTLKFTVNLSSSKIKVNSILALDSLDGQRVPKLSEIEAKIGQFKSLLLQQDGISNVKTEFNAVDLIVKLTVDFKSLNQLQEGIQASLNAMNLNKKVTKEDVQWMSWEAGTLKRTMHEIFQQELKRYENNDISLLKGGSYACISRLPGQILKTSNNNCKINPSKTAAMLRINTFDLKNEPSILEHTLSTSP
jgi:hypothetical protein